MTILIIITALAVFITILIDYRRCIKGIKKGAIMFLNILPALLSILAIISIVLYIIPQSVMIKVLGKDSGFMGYVYAALIGSITLIPGFIAYPLAGILVKNNVSYPVIAVFITTLMMVGVITIPIEKRYFGLKTTLLRNSLSFAGALVVGALIGIFWRIL